LNEQYRISLSTHAQSIGSEAHFCPSSTWFPRCNITTDNTIPERIVLSSKVTSQFSTSYNTINDILFASVFEYNERMVSSITYRPPLLESQNDIVLVTLARLALRAII
jgi:hypothetical protein